MLQKTTKNSVIWGMFISVTLESALFMGKNHSDNQHSIKNTKDLTMKQMFDISAKLVSEQDEIYGVKTIDWEDYSWKYLSLIGDEQVISLQRTKVYVFSDSVLCLGKIHEKHPIKHCMGRQIGVVQKFTVIQRFGENWWRANGIRVEYFPGFNSFAAQSRSSRVTLEIRWNTIEV